MEAYANNQFTLRVDNAEVETLKQIIGLAIERLQSSQVRQLSGTPHKSQAGIKGNDLINVKDMLTRLAKELGMGEPSLEPKRGPADDLADVLMYSLLFSKNSPFAAKPTLFGLKTPV
ncbi:hypothetical protein RE432_15025 [Pusillimonas sp. SM2304]|uniref:hypothetical protein n=1 Tax=Pusillimonas sp. SM2304 TaxID=3073241 RepID=UPI002873FA13|nr:hypothetical protein [Pusillimonas sp. SM2304]MDS1141752.1 hypothetical protein [Pusillimonas sp. SM2304]